MMADGTASKTGAALMSPKLTKTAKGERAPMTQVPHVEFGCEHIQQLFQKNRAKTLKEYRILLKKIFDRSQCYTQAYTDEQSVGSYSLGTLWLCLQCPFIHTEAQRNSHIETKGHFLSASSKTARVYCGVCRDLVYDPTLESYRDARGNKPKEYIPSEEDHKLIINNTTWLPCRAVGLRGLYNMGNTCFMSVVLQTLIRNPYVRNFYLNDGHNRRFNNCEREGCVSCALDEMIQEFYTDKTEGFGAVNMLQASWLSGEALAGYQQQDAHEYMQFMLNTLHIQNGGTDEDCKCIIHKTFYGELRSTVTCDKCKNQNVTVEPFMDLSLDVRNQSKKRKADASEQEPTLELTECLERFTGVEKLAAEDYTCHNCKERQSATKQLSLLTVPDVLAIHLKRFEHTKSTSSKIETKVNFRMTMDLMPYTSRYKYLTEHSMDTGWSHYMYELIGVIVHKGKMDSGHYVNFSRRDENWFLFDDSKVVLASLADVLDAEAYILFYKVSEC